MRIGLGTKFQLKLTILIFWTRKWRPWSSLTILNFSTRGQQTQRYLIFLLLLIAETTIFFIENSSVFKADVPQTMLFSNYLIKFLILLKNINFTLGIFIDLSKEFDVVDHSILLKKLKLYGITEKNLSWLESYLSNRKQHILHMGENSKTDLKHVIFASSKDLFLEYFCF